ncbi:hypothetical protein [Frigidibacter sp. MR17.24]|uniref:hypothetical protein n=1 Tax=Frigidibacter sp. MR17.24 TaxID=3127345 RepID=UPI0030131D7F
MLAFFRGLLIPDAQERDAYAWLCNQAGHAAVVGVTAAILLLALGAPPLAVPIIVALIYGAGWEWAVQRSPAGDGLMDTAFVTAGAALITGALAEGLATAAAVQGIWLALLLIGVWRRV